MNMPQVKADFPRDRSLDSLRGIAAVSVLLLHLSYFKPLNELHGWLAGVYRLISFGHEAVVLFFVLSGYVLYLQISRQAMSYLEFMIKRVCRIYLPYFFAIVVAILMQKFLHPHVDLAMGDLGSSAWTAPLSIKTIVAHILLIFPFTNNHLDPVIWSLTYEMRLSLILPLLVWAAQRLGWPVVVLASLLLLPIDTLLLHKQHFGGGVANVYGTWGHTLAYVSDFVIGAWLASQKSYVANKLAPMQTVSFMMFLLGVIAFEMSSRFSIAGGEFYSIYWHLTLLVAIPMILMAVTTNALLQRILDMRVFHWLGDISYSLYLLHTLILLAIVHLVGPEKCSIWTLALVVALSFLAASLSYLYVEKPSIQLGRSIVKRMAGKAALA